MYNDDYCSYQVTNLLRKIGFDEEFNFPGRPTQCVARKWLEDKYGYVIELIVDGWGDDECVSKELFGYRAFIWQYGKPKPKPYDDIGMSKTREQIVNSALITILEEIIFNNSLTD